MPGNNERQGRSTNIFFFHEGSLQGHDVPFTLRRSTNSAPFRSGMPKSVMITKGW